MLGAVVPWIAGAPQHALGPKGVVQTLDEGMHVGIGKIFPRAAVNIRYFHCHIVEASQLDDRLESLGWLVEVGIAHVV